MTKLSKSLSYKISYNIFPFKKEFSKIKVFIFFRVELNLIKKKDILNLCDQLQNFRDQIFILNSEEKLIVIKRNIFVGVFLPSKYTDKKAVKASSRHPLKIASFQWCAFCNLHFDIAEFIFLFYVKSKTFSFDLIILNIEN
ncbi:hypothetical protein BpHYR1_044925 [Brachionus plicatilis]|uniref:Uncharacterized protein n=1 Tax=Brachionus plicatilis TaxID=10195 RepID=A0A3M7R603_BRAPC|nr:hypothetical protein BpHYR1_044925 [Brachionus plicatilis]